MFKEIILQPSADLVLLLDILKAVTLMIFLPGLGILLGTGWTGFCMLTAARSEGNEEGMRKAAAILSKFQLGGGKSFIFTSFPLLSLAIIYAQTLYGTESGLGAAVLMSFGLAVFSTWVWNQYLKSVEEEQFFKRTLEGLSSSAMIHEIKGKLHETTESQGLHGSIGLVGLSLAAMFGFACMDLVLHPAKWENFTIISLTISVSFWMEYFWFLCLGFALSGVAIMSEFRNSDECLARMGQAMAGYSALGLPLLGLISAFALPAAVFTPVLVAVSVLGLIFLIFALGSVFSAMGRGMMASGTLVLLCLLVTSSADAVKLTLAFRNATHHHLSKVMKVAPDKGEHQ